MKIYGSFIHKNPKLQTIQMSVKQRMDKQTVGHLFTGIAVSNKSEQTTYTCSNFDKSQNNMLREIK